MLMKTPKDDPFIAEFQVNSPSTISRSCQGTSFLLFCIQVLWDNMEDIRASGGLLQVSLDVGESFVCSFLTRYFIIIHHTERDGY